MKICLINDENDIRRQFVEWADELVQGVELVAVESAFEANSVRADVYIFDISAVCPMMLAVEHAYSPIASLACNHPGATLVIMSAVGRACAEGIIEDVEKASGIRPIYGGTGDFETLERTLQLKRKR